jgi:UDP-N-acetylglucosamine 2-epimerase (non-hydrolysing)
MAVRKKIMVIFGTRPEATKMGPVIQELKRFPEWFETKVVVTGQHKEQLYQALSHFGIYPDTDLSIMKENQSLAYITSAAITGLDAVIAEEQPDFILIHGDTQTAVCGGMVAFFHKIPVGHIEAGLRSHNKLSPWPEEINRRIVDVVTDFSFAPTRISRDNLIHEGYKDKDIYITGQTAVDAAMVTSRSDYVFKEGSLNHLVKQTGRILTMTVHRKENYGAPMHQMFRAVRRIADENPDLSIIYPVHLSPTVREAAFPLLSGHEGPVGRRRLCGYPFTALRGCVAGDGCSAAYRLHPDNTRWPGKFNGQPFVQAGIHVNRNDSCGRIHPHYQGGRIIRRLPAILK